MLRAGPGASPVENTLIEDIANLMSGLGLGRKAVPLPHDGLTLAVTDSICTITDDSPEVVEVLRSLTTWPDRSFQALVRTKDTVGADATITFPSPRPQGEPCCDEVIVDWHVARDKAGNRVNGAPAALILDILHGENMVSAFVARILSGQGVNAFVMHMPRNGRRRTGPGPYNWGYFLPSLRQAIADARRARDVILALPGISGPVAIQGTSLGGFVTAVTASIDRAYDPVIIALAGGDVFGVLTTGEVDAARVRVRLNNTGMTDDKLRDELWLSEPMRLVHRLDPRRTWMISARRDQVVPSTFSHSMARRIGLPPSHHIKISGCHYTCMINAPRVILDIARIIKGKWQNGAPVSAPTTFPLPV